MKRIFVYILSIFMISLSSCDFVNDNGVENYYSGCKFPDYESFNFKKAKVKEEYYENYDSGISRKITLVEDNVLRFDYEVYKDVENDKSFGDKYYINGLSDDVDYYIYINNLEYTFNKVQSGKVYINPILLKIGNTRFESDSVDYLNYSSSVKINDNSLLINFCKSVNSISFSELEDGKYSFEIMVLKFKHNNTNIVSEESLECNNNDVLVIKSINDYVSYIDIIDSFNKNFNYTLLSIDNLSLENGLTLNVYENSEFYMNYDSKFYIQFLYQRDDGEREFDVYCFEFVKDNDSIIINFFDKVWNWINENIINYSD